MDFDKYFQQLKDVGSGRQSQRVPKTICPRFYGKQCFICNKVEGYLRAYNDDVSEETKRKYLATLIDMPINSPEVKLPKNTWSAAKTFLKRQGFFPSERYYMNVTFPSDPQNVILFEAPPTIGQPLAKLQTGENQDYKDFMHPTRGRNIYIEKTGSGRLANYRVQPRAQVSQLPDMSVLKRMYNLDDIDQLFDDVNVKMTRPSRFEDDSTTEIRVLPNWSFVECLKSPENKRKWEEYGYIAFLTTIWWHFGISPEEFDIYEKGDQLLPFNKKAIKHNPPVEEADKDVPMFTEEASGPLQKRADRRPDSNEGAGHQRRAEESTNLMDKEMIPEDDPCFGQWEDDSVICEVCNRAEECKEATTPA